MNPSEWPVKPTPRIREVYELQCVCGEEIQIPTGASRCPLCGAALDIQWRADGAV